MKGIAGKTVLVTGAASGFGAGIASRFAEEGAEVLVTDINAEAGAAQAAAIGGRFLQMDVADETSVASALGTCKEPVDILVNNAGIGLTPQPLTEVSPEDFERLLGVNVRSIFHTARAIVPGMRERGGGVILNIASTAGVSPRPGLTWYNASKGWVITATRSMAVELASDNIRVNAINPVAGETPLLSTFMGGDTEENRARFLATIPLGRFSTPTDIASAACFLCSDEASMITGVALEVDGGRCV
jgi:3-oxoacyl-[acyl-carrier protein] reductase